MLQSKQFDDGFDKLDVQFNNFVSKNPNISIVEKILGVGVFVTPQNTPQVYVERTLMVFFTGRLEVYFDLQRLLSRLLTQSDSTINRVKKSLRVTKKDLIEWRDGKEFPPQNRTEAIVALLFLDRDENKY